VHDGITYREVFALHEEVRADFDMVGRVEDELLIRQPEVGWGGYVGP
jgi:hypothetical protein